FKGCSLCCTKSKINLTPASSPVSTHCIARTSRRRAPPRSGRTDAVAHKRFVLGEQCRGGASRRPLARDAHTAERAPAPVIAWRFQICRDENLAGGSPFPIFRKILQKHGKQEAGSPPASEAKCLFRLNLT